MNRTAESGTFRGKENAPHAPSHVEIIRSRGPSIDARALGIDGVPVAVYREIRYVRIHVMNPLYLSFRPGSVKLVASDRRQ